MQSKKGSFISLLHRKAARRGARSRMKSRPFFLYLLAFLLPFCIVGIVWALNGIWPFGSKMVLVQDMGHQYYPFFVNLRDKLQNGNSLFYSWTSGMGTNYLSLFAYYLASPLNLLSVLVPEKLLLSFYALEVLIKISCAGLFFAIFARKTLNLKDNTLPFFALMYALCAYIMGYYWNTMWLDSVALLPLVICGTFALLKEKKFILYTVSLMMAVLFNYYIGFFICIFVLLVFIGYSICNWDNFGGFFRRLGRIALFTVLALGMTALLTLPMLLALRSASSAVSDSLPTEFSINIGTSNTLSGIIEGFRKILANAGALTGPTTIIGLPNVACGVATLLLALVFFTCRRIKLREKLFCGFLLLFLIYSFISRRLDFVWHGFHFPNMLPYRFSFLYCFTVVYMAVRAYTHIDELKWYHIVCLTPFLLLFLFCVFTEALKIAIAATAAIILVGSILLVLFSKKKLCKKSLTLFLCACLLSEGIVASIVGVQKVGMSPIENYTPYVQEVQTLFSQIEEQESETPDLYRTVLSFKRTLNDNALRSYNGISVFSSTTNAKVTAFLSSIGIYATVPGNHYSCSLSDPTTNLLLNLKYIISKKGEKNDCAHFSEISASGETVLYKNQYYLPLGWMVNENLLQYNTEAAQLNHNRLENLNSIYQLSTGAQDNLFTEFPVTSIEEIGGCTVTDQGASKYTVDKKVGSDVNDFAELIYTVPKDGSIYLYGKSRMVLSAIGVTVEGEDMQIGQFENGHLMYVGNCKAGTKITVRLSPARCESSNVRLFMAVLEEAAFEQMYTAYSKNSMTTTKLTDTEVEGTITVSEPGLFYTSIPADKGWRAEVDGEETEITPVGDALVAFHLEPGKHTIRLTFEPPGFAIGWPISLICLLVFLLFVIISLNHRNRARGVSSGAAEVVAREDEKESQEEASG